MRRHFGQGVFESDETSFDTTAFPSSRFGFQFARVALWYLRQNPDHWPRSETRFEDDLRDGLVIVVRELSKYVTLSVTTEASTDRLTFENFNEKFAIDFKGSNAIEVFSQEPDIATDSSGLNGAKSSLFQPGSTPAWIASIDVPLCLCCEPLSTTLRFFSAPRAWRRRRRLWRGDVKIC